MLAFDDVMNDFLRAFIHLIVGNAEKFFRDGVGVFHRGPLENMAGLSACNMQRPVKERRRLAVLIQRAVDRLPI